jgi:ADP-ribosylglycohydrolase
MPIPTDYVERVYAGVLGKIIGVYLGRPFEGWSHERILAELGEVNYYVAEKLGVPLVVTDDDISGTFTFIRALEDYGCTRDITAEQIGRTWLNYIIENKTILWWGGLGMSTEHTAFLRMKQGIPAPRSGSIELNGKIVAEQIGAQIFIDAWAMVAPGDPELATDFARKAASVSHDGEAIYAAQVVAAIESMAFVENDINKLTDIALTFIPKDCLIAKMIADLRRCRQSEPDWRKALKLLAADYGYDKYGGNCHVIPNHGVIILSLLYGEDSFQKSLMIANTCGWDTDCNSGNVGCIMGIKNFCDTFYKACDSDADWLTPVNDRLYLSTSDGGRCITDAAIETYRLVNLGRALAGEPPIRPKNGARFHFSLWGSLQGWRAENEPNADIIAVKREAIAHGSSAAPLTRIWQREYLASGGCPEFTALYLRCSAISPDRPGRASTITFTPLEAQTMPGYAMLASPTLYSGQILRARVSALVDMDYMLGEPQVVACRPFIRVYDADDALVLISGPPLDLLQRTSWIPAWEQIEWRIPDTDGRPIAEIGVELSSKTLASGALYVDYLTWSGPPDCTFKRPTTGGTMWQRAWVDSGQSLWWGHEPFRLISNNGRATLSTGTDDWTDYRVSTTIEPNLAKSFGLAARVRGLRRFYALLLDTDGSAKLIKVAGHDTVLAQCPFPWELTKHYTFALEVIGHRIRASINDRALFDITDTDHPLITGGIALVCEEGRIDAGPITVKPAS